MRTAAALVLLVVLALPVMGQQPIRVFVDSEEIRFDVPPVEVAGRVLVPLRGIFERLGATVLWEPSEQRIVATAPGRTIELRIGQREARVNEQPTTLDVPPLVVGGRTMVPLRFVATSLGASVQYDARTRTVYVFSAQAAPRPPAPPPAAQTQAIEGTLVTVDAATSRIQVQVGTATYTIVVTPQTAIFRTDAAGTGGAAPLATLRPGDQVRVEITPTSEAVTLRASYRMVQGRVDLLTPTAIALQGGGVFSINANAALIVGGVPVALSQLVTRVRRDDEVVLRLNPATNEVWEIQATPAATTPVPPPAPDTRTVTIGAVADATVDEATPTAAYPRVELRAGRAPGGRVRALVRFNLPTLPPGAVIVSARLRLFFYGYQQGGTDTFSVFRVALPWTGTVTWATQPPVLPVPADSGPLLALPQNRQVEWDVTTIVREWYGGGANFGVMLRSSEGPFSVARFGFQEGPAGQRPALILTYRVP